ncbi:MAG TPA: hypothetical protein VF432_26150 [Thermoanaerobaculia bacterium]
MPQFLLLAAVLTLVPQLASAHERQALRVGGKTYIVVVGFSNEPVFVGDKSGVDLRVRLADPKAPLNFSSPNVKAVEKLESSLQVEISAGGRKKVFDLETVFRDPGAYRAHFFPTAATTYGFRIFGKLNAVPVELTFTCHAVGHAAPGEDRSEVKLSNGVTRIFQAGGFGCPAAKEAAEFP